MPLARPIITDCTRTVYTRIISPYFAFLILAELMLFSSVSAQDNSPYSRYGIGDLTPPTNITTRGMGGVSAAYSDVWAINFNNPATFSGFQIQTESRSKKMVAGRAILDVGMDFENRSLRQSNPSDKFNAANALFSYVQIGLPIKKNAGISFGIRPLSRISYKINSFARLYDPVTQVMIDSAVTNYSGDGGAYLVSAGGGIVIFKDSTDKGIEKNRLSFGLNTGYLFGKQDYSTKRALINDTVAYRAANFESKTNFNNYYLSAGFQWKKLLDTGNLFLTLGAYGNLGQKMNATRDIKRETYTYDTNLGDIRLDSVTEQNGLKGKINLPASYTFGFLLYRQVIWNNTVKKNGWMIGADLTMQNWNNYRFYGSRDSVRNSWQIRIGGQILPVPSRNFFGNTTFRMGFFFGPDYIHVDRKMNVIGGSLGIGLPLPRNNQVPYQVSLVNISLEYAKRGNNKNVINENLFRLSLGISLSDFWFRKRKYD